MTQRKDRPMLQLTSKEFKRLLRPLGKQVPDSKRKRRKPGTY
jgi:hypothetical protein